MLAVDHQIIFPMIRLEIASNPYKNPIVIRKLIDRLERDPTVEVPEELSPEEARSIFYDELKEAMNNIDRYFYITAQPIYKHWVLLRYVNGKIKNFREISKAVSYLHEYYMLKIKNKLYPEYDNIQRIKSVSDLINIIKEHETRKPSAKEIHKAKEQKLFDDGEAVLYYNDEKIKVIIPKTKKAAIHFGVDTAWCTSASVSRNWFAAYHKKGTLYYTFIKGKNKGALHGEKYAIHAESHSIVNAANEKQSSAHVLAIHPVYQKIFKGTQWDPSTPEDRIVGILLKILEIGAVRRIDYILRDIEVENFSIKNKIRLVKEHPFILMCIYHPDIVIALLRDNPFSGDYLLGVLDNVSSYIEKNKNLMLIIADYVKDNDYKVEVERYTITIEERGESFPHRLLVLETHDQLVLDKFEKLQG